MTSPRTTSDRGFTLVELLLVLALAVLVAAMATPSLTGTLDRVRLDAAAEQVRDAWSAARMDAIRTGQPVAFQCRLGTPEYGVSSLDSAATAWQDAAATPERNESIGEYTFQQLSLGAVGDGAADPSTPACLVFRPDGTTNDAFAIVQAADGRSRTITLRGLTCSASIDSTTEAASP